MNYSQNKNITPVGGDALVDPQSDKGITHVGAHICAHKANKGITLVALIITIIVMLILAAVAINVLFRTKWNNNQSKRINRGNKV